ncbi:DUF6686 family protein [Aureivirga sp. CE67]|uniref:DUF6686 family protein n=1 Tax=Aureivirga sp. CE67 TaxID=1788983 RepID=UPI0018CBD54C|nr:DUF6686 family protein [Aureivirga sp. CE67]
MSHQIELLSRTENGVIYKCLECNHYQIEFKNLNFTFSISGFDRFRNHIKNLYKKHLGDGALCHSLGKNILLPTNSETLKISFNMNELEELFSLFSMRKTQKKETELAVEMTYDFCLN